jgi:hypothetical protein
VAGGIVFALAMVLAVPVGVMLAGAVWSAAFGWMFPSRADEADEETA